MIIVKLEKNKCMPALTVHMVSICSYIKPIWRRKGRMWKMGGGGGMIGRRGKSPVSVVMSNSTF